MSAGTLALTNGSDVVTGSGTTFTTDLVSGDFVVAVVGGITYTLPVKSVESAISLTLISNYPGPSQSGAAWTAVPRATQNQITAALVAQTTEALRGLNYDKSNWQAVFSDSGDITVLLPDGSSFTGPSWKKLSDLLAGLDPDELQQLADQVAADAQQVATDRQDVDAKAQQVSTDVTAASQAATDAAAANTTAQQAKTDAVAANTAAQQAKTDAQAAAASVNPDNLLQKANNLSELANKATARTNLELKSAALADILGTVSQSGGVPTGAIIEQGSNANGNYVKFADGTMICYFRDSTSVTTTTAAGSFYAGGPTAYTFPVAFVGNPIVAPGGGYATGGSVAFSLIRGVSSTLVNVMAYGPNNAGGCLLGYVAFGRWY